MQLKAVGPVAVVGGLLQILIFMFLCGTLALVHLIFLFVLNFYVVMLHTHVELLHFNMVSLHCMFIVVIHWTQLCGAELSEGVFVGCFLSMSSTAVVCYLINLSNCFFCLFWFSLRIVSLIFFYIGGEILGWEK